MTCVGESRSSQSDKSIDEAGSWWRGSVGVWCDGDEYPRKKDDF
jgi:hypothetical protein